MKTPLFAFLLLLAGWLPAQSSLHVPFTRSGGNMVMVNVGLSPRITKKFIFDTGASNISLDLNTFNELRNSGAITNGDIQGQVQVSLADGRTVNSVQVLLKYIKIGNYIIHNVDALVIQDPSAPLLIGQSVFTNFNKISIDNQQSEIVFENYANQNRSIATLKFISCNSNASSATLRRVLPAKFTISKIEEDPAIPPAPAVNKLEASITIRIFNKNDLSIAMEIKDHIASTQRATIMVENMSNYYNTAAYNGYIEIWLK